MARWRITETIKTEWGAAQVAVRQPFCNWKYMETMIVAMTINSTVTTVRTKL